MLIARRVFKQILKHHHKQLINIQYFSKMEGDLNARLNPIVTKLDTPEFHSIFTKNLKDLIGLFKKYDYEIRIAGGAVRDLLMNKIPKDIDIATTATPEQMKTMFTNENIRMINAKGEKHGTITARINDSENFEITTLRIDVVTDGRHAEVEFTKDWLLDANRRDLTINSMFLGFDGSICDYFYGYDDLKKKRVAFVGYPEKRIQEDYLRILRYFRFYGRIADKPDNHEKNTINVIRSNVNGLARISGERIWGELKKILQGSFYDSLLTIMLEQCDCAKYLGLPEPPNIKEFQMICGYNNKHFNNSMHSITLLVGLLYTNDDVINLHNRLKLSAYERDLAIFLQQNKEESKSIDDLIVYQKMCLDTIGRPQLRKEYILELLKYHNKIDVYNRFNNWTIPQFPVGGDVLRANGCPPGNVMGSVLKRLRTIWIENDFQQTADELLNELPSILSELNDVNGKPKKKMKMK